MDRYVAQLLDDIAAAAASFAAFPYSDDEMDEISLEEDLLMARREHLSDRIGLAFSLFPPAGRLKGYHVSQLLQSLEECLRQYGYFPDFPAQLPLVKRYELLRDHLEEEVPVLHRHIWRIDFCTGLPDQCPYGQEFCNCMNFDFPVLDPQDEVDITYLLDWESADDFDWENYDEDRDDFFTGPFMLPEDEDEED
jgi:hypothetical protein